MLFPSTGGELLGPGCSHVLHMSMLDYKEELVASLVAQMVKNLPGDQVQCLGQEDSLQKGMTTHSRILAGRIPWTEETGGLQSKRSQRIGHDWATSTFTEQLRTLQQPPSSFLAGLHLQPCSHLYSPVLRSQEAISLQYSKLPSFLEHTYLLSSLQHRLGYSLSPLFIKDFSSWIPRVSHLQHAQHSYPKSKVLHSNNSSSD